MSAPVIARITVTVLVISNVPNAMKNARDVMVLLPRTVLLARTLNTKDILKECSNV